MYSGGTRDREAYEKYAIFKDDLSDARRRIDEKRKGRGDEEENGPESYARLELLRKVLVDRVLDVEEKQPVHTLFKAFEESAGKQNAYWDANNFNHMCKSIISDVVLKYGSVPEERTLSERVKDAITLVVMKMGTDQKYKERDLDALAAHFVSLLGYANIHDKVETYIRRLVEGYASDKSFKL